MRTMSELETLLIKTLNLQQEEHTKQMNLFAMQLDTYGRQMNTLTLLQDDCQKQMLVWAKDQERLTGVLTELTMRVEGLMNSLEEREDL